MLALLAAAATLVSVYQLGYQRGSQDALDWQFSAVVGGKVMPVGRGSTLLRSRVVPPRPINSVNGVSERFEMKR
jgi:hypothetical protein